MKIYPYAINSRSSKLLSESLNIKRIRHEGEALHLKLGESLINWGNPYSKREIVCTGEILNNFEAVKKASNKLETFNCLFDVSTPDWTDSHEKAEGWTHEGFDVVARLTLNGHSGKGIVIGNEITGVPIAPLYTKYIPKKEEYRIHVFRENVFLTQRKARNKQIPYELINWRVRNHANGFIFSHKDVDVPEFAKQEAIMAVNMLGLDFGAVDIILGTDGKWYVLEVNTACGIEGETLNKYVEQFKEFK